MNLRDEILAGNFDLENRDDGAIAAALSVNRTKVIPMEIGDGKISLALGMPDGPLFLYQLETVANTPPAADATAQEIAQYAVIRQAWRSISKSSFDVGDAAVRAGIDSFVGLLLTQEQADAIKKLAVVGDPISVNAVSDELNLMHTEGLL